jgi:hypothetical protein
LNKQRSVTAPVLLATAAVEEARAKSGNVRPDF